MEVQFVDGTAVEDALKELRSPETSDTDWVAITYDNAKTMKMRLLGKGNGGADEMRGVLENTLAVFGMVRLIDRVDNSDTVKFCRVFFLGEKVPRMLKAKISVHQAAVKELLGQSHVDYECSTPEELTSDIVFEKVTVVSGTSSRVLDQKGGKPLGHAGQQVTTGSVPKTGPKREEIDTDTLFENEAEAREMLQDVRDDSTETTYAIYEFDGKHLVPKTSGVGAVDAALAVRRLLALANAHGRGFRRKRLRPDFAGRKLLLHSIHVVGVGEICIGFPVIIIIHGL